VPFFPVPLFHFMVDIQQFVSGNSVVQQDPLQFCSFFAFAKK